MKFLSFPSAHSRLYFLSKRTAKLCTFFELTKFLVKIFSFSFSVPFWPYSHNCSQLRMQRYCYFWYLQIISILFLNYFLFAWFDATYNITLPFWNEYFYVVKHKIIRFCLEFGLSNCIISGEFFAFLRFFHAKLRSKGWKTNRIERLKRG